MFTFFTKKYISIAIVLALSFSCLGMGLGMLGHVLTVDYPTLVDVQNDSHSCCGLDKAEQDNSTMISMHDKTVFFDLNKLRYLLFIIFVANILYKDTQLFIYTFLLRLILYKKFLERIYIFYCNFLKRLFSQGILHGNDW